MPCNPKTKSKMRKIYTYLLFAFALIAINNQNVNAQCSVAGIASATKDSICDNDSTTLLLAGYTGSIQWQRFNGSIWVNETGPGATTDLRLPREREDAP